MLAPERNDRGAAHFLQSFFFNWQMRFAFFIFLTSLSALLLQHFFYIRSGSFQLAFVLGGLTLEFFLVFVLWSAYYRERINRSALGRYAYLVYTTVGLAFTIYLAHSYGHEIAALIRFLAVLVLLFSFVPPNAIKWHLSFFFIGLLLYQLLEDHHLFEKGRWTLIALYGLSALLVWCREKGVSALQKKLFFLRLHKRRWENKHRRVHVAFEEVLKSLTSSQNAEQLLQGKKTSGRCGAYLLLGFAFPGIHKALWYFRSDPAYSGNVALSEFQREWNIHLDYIRRKLSFAGLDIALATDTLFAGKLLMASAPAAASKARFSPEQKKLIFQVFFIVHDLLQFSRRTRHSIENRGLSGWYTTALMAFGEAACVAASLSNPALVFRGPLVESLGDVFYDIKRNDRQGQGNEVLEDQLWLQPLLHPLYERCFDMVTARSYRGWKSPEFLLSEYTRDRSGLKPNERFWASLTEEP